MKFLKYSLGYRAPKIVKTDPEAANLQNSKELKKVDEEDTISKSFSNMYTHSNNAPTRRIKDPLKAFETNRRMTIYELASTNYIGVQESRPVELLKKEL
jgi:hypothetical protein